MKHILAATALILTTAGAAQADEVSDTLESALQAYNEGDIKYALEELEYAKQLIGALKTNALESYLPAAPDGWTREIDNAVAVGMALFGGSVGVGAVYTSDSGRFTINIMVDNPMVGAMSGMISNAGLLGAKLERVGRMKYLNQDGELSGVINNRIVVQASGAPAEVMIPFLEQIDVRELGNFGN